MHQLARRLLSSFLILLMVVPAATAHAGPRRPALVVLLMIDQMRGDYPSLYGHQWTNGLHRLFRDGAWYQRASYPYVNTVTCAGHATVSTGTLPSVHGMVMNTWWDRARSAVVACADDPTAIDLSYGQPVDTPGESAAALLVPTFADRLRLQTGGQSRVVSLSLKARAALTLGGQRPDVATWVVDQGAWVTSTALGRGLDPAVAKYVREHPVEHQFFQTWDRTLAPGQYLFSTKAVGVRQDAWQPTFPHTVQTWDDWQASPLSDEYLVDMALNVLDDVKLGAPGHIDMLAISFSALDLVGHIYGPDSHEVQDILIRLDRTIARLLDGLDRRLGRGQYTIALSADHGLAPTPERSAGIGIDAGRLQARTVTDAAQRTLASLLGNGRWVNRLLNGDLYLSDGAMDALENVPNGPATLRQALEALPGVRAVFTRDQLTGYISEQDTLLQAAANGYMAQRSGDVLLVFQPHWLVGGAGGASHGTPYRYDAHVPIVLYGQGVAAGVYQRQVTPLDIAPTLATLTGVSLPQAQGHPLKEALRKAGPAARPLPLPRTASK